MICDNATKMFGTKEARFCISEAGMEGVGTRENCHLRLQRQKCNMGTPFVVRVGWRACVGRQCGWLRAHRRPWGGSRGGRGRGPPSPAWACGALRQKGTTTPKGECWTSPPPRKIDCSQLGEHKGGRPMESNGDCSSPPPSNETWQVLFQPSGPIHSSTGEGVVEREEGRGGDTKWKRRWGGEGLLDSVSRTNGLVARSPRSTLRGLITLRLHPGI